MTDTNLTDTQREVMDDLCHGYRPAQIALIRRVTRRTIMQHMADARQRLGAQTRDQAVAIFVRMYWAE